MLKAFSFQRSVVSFQFSVFSKSSQAQPGNYPVRAQARAPVVHD
jgi:hypothetical protein